MRQDGGSQVFGVEFTSDIVCDDASGSNTKCLRIKQWQRDVWVVRLICCGPMGRFFTNIVLHHGESFGVVGVSPYWFGIKNQE